MRPSQARFVTACQQLLALAVVLVVLAPAAGVATLDVVDRLPGGGTGPSAGDLRVAPGQVSSTSERSVSSERSEVEAAPVGAAVVERRLTTVAGRGGPASRSSRESLTAGTVLSEAEPVTGYGAVGVTWSPEVTYDEDEIAVSVRTRTGDGGWTAWDELEYHDEHAPDPGSAEARGARPGTEPVFVGEVDEVQVRTESPTAGAPEDLRMAVITPGESAGTEVEAPEYGGQVADEDLTSSEGDLALRAASPTQQPMIYSRRQWGADERMRSGSPRYGSIKGGFVHHTVNANDYSRDQVPGMLRSIYAYHTRSLGWSDVGYNFLVDRFGRIWEGRAGGVTRPVVGAHTFGYNHESFAMSAIGNFEVTGAPEAMIRAYGHLMGWRLGLAGVNAATSVTVAGRRFAAISGHRDAGSTACPGRFLYAKLPQIRSLARAAQTSGGSTPAPPPAPEPPPTPQPPAPAPISGSPDLDSNLMGTPHPDVVVRRGADNRVLVLRTAGGTGLASPRTLGRRFPASARLLASPDLTGDGRADLVSVDGDRASIHPGTGTGGFRNATRVAVGFDGMSLVVAAGDLNGDGRPDLVGRLDAGGRLFAFLGTPRGGFTRTQIGTGWGTYDLVTGVGDLDGDGLDDLLGKDKEGRLFVHPAAAAGAEGGARLAPRRQVPGSHASVNAILGVGDADRDGRPDLLVRRDGGSAYLHPLDADLTLGPGYGPVAGLAGLAMMTSGPDLTGDGWPDVLARRGDQVVLVPHRGTTETLPPHATNLVVRGANRIMAAGDMDGDGRGDLVVRQGNGVINLFRGDGAGQFTAKVTIGRGFSDVTGLAPVGDVTGDDRGDLFGTRGGRHLVWPGAGRSVLGAPRDAPAALVAAMRPSSVSFAGYDSWHAVSDLHLAGRPDLVLVDRERKLLWSQNQRRDRTYDSRRLLARWSGNWNLFG